MTAFGVFHTVIDAIALVCGFIALAPRPPDSRRATRSGRGRAYLATALLAATAFGIFHHGSWGPPHTLAVLTLVALAVGLVWQGRWLRRVGAREPIPVCRGRKRITHFIGVSGGNPHAPAIPARPTGRKCVFLKGSIRPE
jgi:hypothetical protein